MEVRLNNAQPRQVDPEEERFHLYEGVTQFLIGMSRDAPLVVFIDDLQWADELRDHGELFGRLKARLPRQVELQRELFQLAL